MAKKETKFEDFELIAKSIVKEFGPRALIFGKENDITKDLIRIPTGLFTLDLITGGGYPEGRIVEIYGRPGVGKTFAGLACIVANQERIKRQGRKVIFLDVEGAFNYEWAEKLGVNTSSEYFIISRADYAEDYLEILDRVIRSGAVGLAVLDSVAALVTKEEVEKNMSEDTMAKQARLMNKALKKLGPACLKNKATLILINQMRASMQPYGARWVVPGGHAREYWVYMMIEMRYAGYLESKKGHIVQATVMKNKTAAPFKSANFTLFYENPIFPEYEILSLAESLGLIDKRRNGYFFLDDQNLGRAPDVINKLKKDRQLFNRFQKQMFEIIWGGA